MADDALRAACFASLDVLCATHGEDVPYRSGLEAGFAFRGGRVPFLSPQKGIYRAAAQEGRAALSINTSFQSPYDDEETPKASSTPIARGRSTSRTTGRSSPPTPSRPRSSTSSPRSQGATDRSTRST